MSETAGPVMAPPEPAATARDPERETNRAWDVDRRQPAAGHSLDAIAIEPGLSEQVQARLVMGRPGDAFEDEADRAADAVVGSDARAPQLSHDAGQAVRRQQLAGPELEDEEDEDEEKEEPVQARPTAGGTPEVTPGLARQIRDAGSEGRPLDGAQREFFERRFGHDFGCVRVHTGPRAAEAAEAARAQAFTRGQDIYFGAGYHRPESAEGRWLIAHELTHTVQQRPDVVARQPVATAEPPGVEEPVAAGEGGDTDAMATELTDDLRADPRDGSRRLRDRLERLEPAERRAVVARMRGALSPARRMQLETLVAEAAAPGRQAVPPTPEGAGAGPAAREEGAGVAPRARPAAAAAAAPPTPGIAPAPSPPTASAPVPPRPQAPDAAGRAQAQGAARSAEGAARRTGSAAASSDAAAGQAQASTEAVAAEAEGAEGEAAAAGEEGDALPTIAELVEPLPESPEPEPAEEELAAEPAEPVPAEGVEALAGPAGPEVEPSPPVAPETEPEAPGAPEPEAEEPTPEGEPVDVASMVEQITAAPAEAEARLQGEAEAVGTAVRQRSGAVIGSVRSNVSRTAAQVSQEFAAKRTALEGVLSTARSRIDTQLEAKRAELRTKGDEARTRITGVFDDHRAAIQQAVDDSIAATDELRTRYTGLASSRTAEKARTARQRGAAKASGYPRTERGGVQADAARGVADRTAREIEEKEPETVEAIEEVVAEIPAKFDEEGAKTLQGYDEPLPGLLADVDRQIAAADEELGRAADSARTYLENMATSLRGELDAAEAAAIARIEALGPRAEAQIGSATRHALREIDQGVPRAMENIDPVAEEAAGILEETESPDPERARAFTDAVLSFIGGAADEGSAALGEAGQLVTEQLQGADASAKQSLAAARRQATTQMTAAEEQRNRRISAFSARADGELATPLTTFETHITQTEARTREGFAPAVADLQAKFRTTLRDADSRCARALDEGMVKNDEALGELDEKMNEAASDAAWDYDHPILSAIGDVLSVIAGVIVGILAVIALVVVVIVAVKLLVAGLVVLGVAAATAALVGKIILIGVAVAGIGMLAYGAYQSYSARRAQGAGFWEAVGGAAADVTGITDMRRAFEEEGLSPFDRGFFFGRGAATLVTTVIGGRKMVTRFRSRMPARLPNPGSVRTPAPRGAPATPPRAAPAAAPPAAAPAPAAAPRPAAPTAAPAGAPRPAAPTAALAGAPRPAAPTAALAGAPRPAAPTAALAGAPRPAAPTAAPAGAPRPAASTTAAPTTAPPPTTGVQPSPAAPHLRPLPTQQAPRLSPPRGQLRSVPLEPRPAAPGPARAPGRAAPPQAQPQVQAQPQPQQLQLAAGGEGRVIAGGGPAQPRFGVIQGGARGTPAGGRVGGDIRAAAPRGPAGGGVRPGGGGARAGGPGGARGGGGPSAGPARGGPSRGGAAPGGGGRGRPRPGGGGGRARARRPAASAAAGGRGGRGGTGGRPGGAGPGGGGRGAGPGGGGRGGGRGGRRAGAGGGRAPAQPGPRGGAPAQRPGAPGRPPPRRPPAVQRPVQPGAAPGRTGPNVGHRATGPANNPVAGWGKGQIPCFPAGTLVATPAGPLPIESLTPGADVYAFDLARGERVAAAITAAPRGHTRCWVDVVLDRGTLCTTRHHPVWVESKRAWLDALALTAGMSVRLRDGTLATVRRIAVRPLDRVEPTFNLLVDRLQTYFAGDRSVLVHNGTPLGQPGHNVYVLARNGRIYYVGRFGPNETRESVIARHSRTPKNVPGVEKRFVPGRDQMRVLQRNLTYAEARRLEHEVCVKANTYKGRGATWRCNRDYPMSPRKFSKYYVRRAC